MYAILTEIAGHTCALGFGQWTPIAELAANGKGLVLHPAGSIDAAVRTAKRNWPRHEIRPALIQPRP